VLRRSLDEPLAELGDALTGVGITLRNHTPGTRLCTVEADVAEVLAGRGTLWLRAEVELP
jgi:hypothetical protein